VLFDYTTLLISYKSPSAQDRDSWRTIVSEVINLRIPQNTGNFFSSWWAVTSSGKTVPWIYESSFIRKYFATRFKVSLAGMKITWIFLFLHSICARLTSYMHEPRCGHPRYSKQNIFCKSADMATIGNVIITSNRFKVKRMRAAINDALRN